MIGTRTAYAKHRRDLALPGGSGAAVTYAVQAGRIKSEPDGSIDFEQADKDWAVNTSPGAMASGVGAAVHMASP